MNNIINEANKQLLHYLAAAVKNKDDTKEQDRILTGFINDLRTNINNGSGLVTEVARLLSDMSYEKEPGIRYLPVAFDSKDRLFIELQNAMAKENETARKVP